jgi:uracil-DNA glycosylase family 4
MDYTLAQVQASANSCNVCGLGSTRQNAVFADGSGDERIMLIGEGPGEHEDEQGIPFVGLAGKLLNELLEEFGMDRKKIYICNVLKCRPPGNATPSPFQTSSCANFLYWQIKLVDPKLIITMGNPATKFVLSKVFENKPVPGITTIRGKEFRTPNDRLVIPVLHTAYILRDMSKLDLIKMDMKLISQHYKEIYSQV